MIGGIALREHQARLLLAAVEELETDIEMTRDELSDAETPEARHEAFESMISGGILPRKHLLRYDTEFLRDFDLCLESVAFKLVSPRSEHLGCTGEELALAAVFGHLDYVIDEELIGEKILEQTKCVASREDIKEEMNDLHSMMIEDADYEILFDDAMDGLESDDSPVARQLGFANLEFKDWFVPFNGDRYVHWKLSAWTLPVPVKSEVENPSDYYGESDESNAESEDGK